jgi:2-methylaconitate cis-trans-isomerase PrpF
MRNLRLRAVFMRGGTSKAIMFRRQDLPSDSKLWDSIFLQVMGTPDPNGRQLDGMGGGVSSLSKVCIVGPSSRADADVDYTFAQVAVTEAVVDYAGNCGNMSAAVGPFALEEQILAPAQDGEAVVRIHNTNTSKIIVARFPVVGGALAAEGGFEIDGVAGSAAPVRLEFLDPGGSKSGLLLPTGEAQTTLAIPGYGSVAASCVDAANPCVFVRAEDLGKAGIELPQELEKDSIFLERMESLRRAASVRMRLAPDLDSAARLSSIPKIGMVSAGRDALTLSGRALRASQTDLCVRMISVGQPHRAIPITGAVCAAVATRVPGSIPHQLCAATTGALRIGHPSGTTVVDAAVTIEADGPRAHYGAVYRSARRLFEGRVVYRG